MICIFGDSFSGVFKLLKSDKYKTISFHGATARGLSKPDNKNRIKIIETVNTLKPSCIIFNFGSVDTYLSIYYRIFVESKVDNINDYYGGIVRDYLDFIKSLGVKNIHIILPGYNPVSDDKVITAFQRYKSLPNNLEVEEQYVKLFSRKVRNEFVDTFNNILINMVKKSKDKINVISVNKIILKNKKFRKEFVDKLSPYNIHYRWEPLIEPLIDAISNNDCKFNKSDLGDMKSSESEYIKDKTARFSAYKTSPIKIEDVFSYKIVPNKT